MQSGDKEVIVMIVGAILPIIIAILIIKNPNTNFRIGRYYYTDTKSKRLLGVIALLIGSFIMISLAYQFYKENQKIHAVKTFKDCVEYDGAKVSGSDFCSIDGKKVFSR
jgi:hypothetical protein